MTVSDEHARRAAEPDMQAAIASAMRRPARGGPIPLALIAGLYAAFEALVVTAVCAATGAVYYYLAFGEVAVSSVHIELGALIAFLVVSASLLQGSYRANAIHAIAEQPDKLVLSILFGLLALIILLFAAKRSIDYSRMVIAISGVAIFFALLASRRLASHALHQLSRQNWISLPRLLLVGHHSLTAQLLAQRNVQATYSVVGTVDVPERPGDASLGDALASARRLAQTADADVVLCLPWSDRAAIESAIARLVALPSAVFLYSDPHLRTLAGTLGVSGSTLGHVIVRRPLSRPQLALKRAFDIAGSAAGLVVLSPVLALVALLIKLDSPGPVLFRQQRYGYHRMPFQVYKFRTMTAESSRESFRQATRHDARVTRIGRLLRKASLDELPQLFNVLAGSMSLVGPRPHPVELDEQFTPLIAHYATRHKIKPGITGWAQVKGHRGETGSTAQMADRIAHDLHYLNHWSFWLDVKILIMTLSALASQRNAV